MSYEYSQRKRADRIGAQQEASSAQPSLDALRAGTVKPTQEQKGSRVDLPDAMRSRMENAFGADLSAVKLYESQAVADAGADAFSQGAEIAFAPGMLDFTSYSGQALLGHELSHVVSQARGEVTGSGFLNDASLEARADREGAMAAAGQTVAMPSAAMSSVTASAAAGPIQASHKEKRKQRKIAEQRELQGEAYFNMITQRNSPRYKKELDAALAKERELAGKDAVIAPNPLLTGTGLLDRAKARATDKDGTLDTGSYFNMAETILNHMSDEQLNSPEESAFRERLVDECSAARGRQLAQGGGGDAFTEPNDIGYGGFLPKMYARMMGVDQINASLGGSSIPNALGSIAALADAKGVTSLLARQQMGTYGAKDAFRKQGDTMRDFWKYTISSHDARTEGRNAYTNRTARDTKIALESAPEDIDDASTRQATAGFKSYLTNPMAKMMRDSATAVMPKIDGAYSSTEMASDVNALAPELYRDVEVFSKSNAPTSGNRFAFMRSGKKGDGTNRSPYFKQLQAAGRDSSMNMHLAMSQSFQDLPSTESLSYKALQAQRPEVFDAYQSRAADMTQYYLAYLSQSPDAMDALRQSSAMYAGLGAYSDANKKGLIGGQLEADQRAMNDLLLRSFGPDVQTARPTLGLSQEDEAKHKILGSAINFMQSKHLQSTMDPHAREGMSPHELRAAQAYEAFFARLHQQP
jgi:hypothetical protein